MWGRGGLVLSSRNVHFGQRQRWGWTDDNARRWHVWTLNDLPEKVIHHIWNVLWQPPRDGYRHHPASISQKAQPPGHGEGLRADDGWAPFISRPNVNREESFKLKCEQGWQPVATAGLPHLNMQPFGLVSPFFSCRWNNVRWYKVAPPVCTQNYQTWLNRKALWAEEGSCLHFTSTSGRPGDLYFGFLAADCLFRGWRLDCMEMRDYSSCNVQLATSKPSAGVFLPSLT